MLVVPSAKLTKCKRIGNRAPYPFSRASVDAAIYDSRSDRLVKKLPDPVRKNEPQRETASWPLIKASNLTPTLAAGGATFRSAGKPDEDHLKGFAANYRPPAASELQREIRVATAKVALSALEKGHPHDRRFALGRASFSYPDPRRLFLGAEQHLNLSGVSSFVRVLETSPHLVSCPLTPQSQHPTAYMYRPLPLESFAPPIAIDATKKLMGSGIPASDRYVIYVNHCTSTACSCTGCPK